MMKRLTTVFIKILTSIIFVLMLTNYGITFIITSQLNKSFQNKEIDLSYFFEDYKVKFNNISSSLIPFSFAWRINGYIEENREAVIEFATPIYIGYNLVKRCFYLTFAGDIIAKYKPIQSGFGVKVKTDTNKVRVYLTSNLKLLSYIFGSKKKQPNFLSLIDRVDYHVKNFQVFDLIDNAQIYHQDHELYKIKLAGQPDYSNNFQDGIPKKLDIYMENRIINTIYTRRILPSNLLLGLKFPIKVNIKNKIEIATNKKTLEEAKKSFSFKINNLDIDSKIHNGHAEFFYQINDDNNNYETVCKLSALIKIKSGFFAELFNLFTIVSNFLDKYAGNKIIPAKDLGNYINILNNIISNKDKFSISQLEDKEYKLNLDLKHTMANVNELQINTIEFRSGDTGIKITGDYKLQYVDKSFYSPNNINLIRGNGNIAFYNYLTFMSFITENIRPLTDFLDINELAYSIYTKSYIDFLKNISDNPDLKSKGNINIKLVVNEKNILQSKIGNISIDNYNNLFKLQLYRTIIDNISNNSDRDGFIDNIGQLINTEEKVVLLNLVDKPNDVSLNEIIKLLK